MTAKKTKTKSADISVLNTNLHAIFATNVEKEEDGAWVTVNDVIGLRIKVRRLRSDASLKAYEDIVKEQIGEGAIRQASDFTEEQQNAILREQLARGVLVDWEKLRDINTGDLIPYSLDTSRALMEVRDFREFVLQSAAERDVFKDSLDADAVKN